VTKRILLEFAAVFIGSLPDDSLAYAKEILTAEYSAATRYGKTGQRPGKCFMPAKAPQGCRFQYLFYDISML
jgi:hypothetical protein